MNLNQRERDVLGELYYANRSASHPVAWARPLDVGGSNGSHHWYTLQRLEKYGLAQSKQRGHPDPVPGQAPPKYRTGSRGSKVYRITDEGVKLIASDEIARLRKALMNVRTSLFVSDANKDAITDTLWMDDEISFNETVLDHIDNALGIEDGDPLRTAAGV